MKNKDILTAEELFYEMEKIYRKTFPVGTVSANGNYIMRSDGMWWGRCIISPLFRKEGE